jgi:hypothetical protein
MHRVANSRRDSEAGPEGKCQAGSQRLLGDNHTRRLGHQMHWAKHHHKSNDEVDLRSSMSKACQKQAARNSSVYDSAPSLFGTDPISSTMMGGILAIPLPRFSRVREINEVIRNS